MAGLISRRVFPFLQLTRIALVFTAISNSLCTLFLWTYRRTGNPVIAHVSARECFAIIFMSTGLYGFGMSLNDIIDRRRDESISPNRPLPSGRIGVATAHIVCAFLIAMAIVADALYVQLSAQGWISMVLLLFTGALIVFYDYAAKYLVAVGLLSLGLIRFFHAVVPAPQMPLVWQPLLLLNHVTLLSLVAYRWEEKRPALTPIHWWLVPGALAVIDALLIALIAWRRATRMGPETTLAQALWITPALIAPAAAAIVFVLLAWFIRRRSATPREAGQRLMLYGLLWLILYDALFVAGYVGWLPAAILIGLLPLAYASVQVMRWWGGVVALSQRPAFKRVEL